MRIQTEGFEEIDGKRCIATYSDGELWAWWEVGGNAPDNYPGVCVPDGYLLVSGSVTVHEPLTESTGDPDLDFIRGVGLYDHPLVNWQAIKEDQSEICLCKNHFE